MTSHHRWTDEEVQSLREMAARGWPTSRIARDLGLSENTVAWKRRALSLPSGRAPTYEDLRQQSLAGRGGCIRWHGSDCGCWRKNQEVPA